MSFAADTPHRRILASAGTGKTYQLTSRYLQLVLEGADPRTILATTFTRAAAAEIRTRILGTAARALVDADKRHELAERTGRPDARRVTAAARVPMDRIGLFDLYSCFPSAVGITAQELGRRSGGELR